VRSDAPWIAILALTAFFQFLRGAPVDGVIFLAVALALVADATGLLRRLPLRPHVVRRATTVVVVIVLAVLLTALPRYSVADGVIVAAVGVTALLLAWPGDDRARDRPQARAGVRRAAMLWATLGVLTCLWEVTMFFLGMPSPEAEYAHPPLSDLVGPLLDNPVLRFLLVVAWLAGGAALLRRGRHGGGEHR
jgi:hypothetical protein